MSVAPREAAVSFLRPEDDARNHTQARDAPITQEQHNDSKAKRHKLGAHGFSDHQLICRSFLRNDVVANPRVC